MHIRKILLGLFLSLFYRVNAYALAKQSVHPIMFVTETSVIHFYDPIIRSYDLIVHSCNSIVYHCDQIVCSSDLNVCTNEPIVFACISSYMLVYTAN